MTSFSFPQEVRHKGEDSREGDDALLLDLDGFEGPLDLLLSLAREQKIDLLHISILALADQYMSYIDRARTLHLDIAADYLVMAAWLAYLKSRLLLPTPPQDDEDAPDAGEMAEILAHRLRRYNAVKEAVIDLIARPLLGRDVFARGDPLRFGSSTVYRASLHDLLRAYGQAHRDQASQKVLRVLPSPLCAMDDALRRLEQALGGHPGWLDLRTIMAGIAIPSDVEDTRLFRLSTLATGLAASLELVKNGQADIVQDSSFAPIRIRRCTDAHDGDASGHGA